MKKLLTLICTLSVSALFAQNVNLATYKLKYLFSNNEQENRFSGIYDRAEQYEDDVKIQLIFNADVAVSVSNFEDKNSENRTAFNFCNCEKPVFYNLKNNTIKQKNVGHIPLNIEDEKYLITDILNDKEWVLENESKLINGFEAFKATKIYTTIDNVKKAIIAWYAPEIPYSFGPNGYAGLPGLIVQVQFDDRMFVLDRIEFNQNVAIPEEPTKGVIVTSQEYKKMEHETYLNMRKK